MKKISAITLFLLVGPFLLIHASDTFSLSEHVINGKSYVSLYDIALKTDIQQNFDVISQRGKLFHKHHYALFQSGFSAFVVNDHIYKSSYPIIRQNGELFLPSVFFEKMIELFYPNLQLVKSNRTYSLARRPSPPIADVPIVDLQPSRPMKDPITFVVIDPGHGGRDPGAIGGSVQEKDLVLPISIQIRDHLKKQMPDVTIVMTRETDRFIPLDTRTEMANKKLKKNTNGLFISLHANASISSRTSGFETYVLSQNPTNEEARATASLENNVVILEERKDRPYQDVEYIEALMLTTQIQNESLILAEKVQNSMKLNMTQSRSRGVKKADFFVLRGALMPAILVEIGYITNKNERNLLVTSAYQNKVAQSVADGIIDFINHYNENIR